MDFLLTLIGATFRISTPILFASLGETIVERSGILNLGIEGTMLLSAFGGFLAAQITGSLYIGLLVAMLVGIVLSLLMGFLTVTLGVNQHVSGLGITLFATGLALFSFRLIYGGQTTPPSLPQSFTQLPLLVGTPFEPVFSQYWLTYAGFLLVPLIAWVFSRTRF
jgi:ABC-type uncharacterized transport system permease subunit